MINPSQFWQKLDDIGISCFYGVPDSTLKHFCSFISRMLPEAQHTICVNEGVAVSTAIGYYLAGGKVPMIYMQNSGLGNAVNPLTSLVAKEIYAIPLLLLIGWRGEPGINDEPQHIFQGRITEKLLATLEIPYAVLDSNSDIEKKLNQVQTYFREKSSPYALLVRKGTFASVDIETNSSSKNDYLLTREDVIATIVEAQGSGSIIVSSTGMASRELFEVRKRKNLRPDTDFLTVGGMGCASSIALGIASHRREKQVICIDGDGAALMHMGAMGTIGKQTPRNFLHIVINNGEHGSTGGQPVISRDIDLCGVAKACGYEEVCRLTSLTELSQQLQKSSNGLTFIEMMTNNLYRSNLGRPTTSPIDNKLAFMRNLISDGFPG